MLQQWRHSHFAGNPNVKTDRLQELIINPQNNATIIGIQRVPTSQEVFIIMITHLGLGLQRVPTSEGTHVSRGFHYDDQLITHFGLGLQRVPTSEGTHVRGYPRLKRFSLWWSPTLVLDSVPLIGGEVPPRSHLRQMKPWTKRDFQINLQMLEDLVNMILIEASADTLQS